MFWLHFHYEMLGLNQLILYLKAQTRCMAVTNSSFSPAVVAERANESIQIQVGLIRRSQVPIPLEVWNLWGHIMHPLKSRCRRNGIDRLESEMTCRYSNSRTPDGLISCLQYRPELGIAKWLQCWLVHRVAIYCGFSCYRLLRILILQANITNNMLSVSCVQYT